MNLAHSILLIWRNSYWRRALVIALLSDALGFGVVLMPPVQWALDILTAVALLAVLGFRWSLLVAMAIEAVPALELFPAWPLVAAALAGMETRRPPGAVGPEVVSAPRKPPRR